VNARKVPQKANVSGMMDVGIMEDWIAKTVGLAS
jgi:hypothetical protein